MKTIKEVTEPSTRILDSLRAEQKAKQVAHIPKVNSFEELEAPKVKESAAVAPKFKTIVVDPSERS